MYALLKFPVYTGFGAWRVALLLDPPFAAHCLECVELARRVKRLDPTARSISFELGGAWDRRVRLLRARSARFAERFDDEAGSRAAVVVGRFPSFVEDVTRVERCTAWLCANERGIWIDYVDYDVAPVPYSTESMTERQLAKEVRGFERAAGPNLPPSAPTSGAGWPSLESRLRLNLRASPYR